MTAVSSQPRGSRFPTLEKYDVLEELGHGGMATVYRARDLRLGRDVAVKVIHPHLRDSAEAVRRFSIEARAVAKLRHPNIVEVYDVSSASESEQYLVVELLRGVTLRRLLEQHGALPAEVAAAIGVELLGAIAHAHEAGVIHRDIKPENVIVEHRPSAGAKVDAASDGSPPTPAVSSEAPGDRVTLKLTDFGIAKLLDAQGVTSTGQVLGSPAHMAPEQIEGREVDGRADVFGLGVLLYECMVGHLPFQGTNPAQVLRRVLDGEYPSAERERPTVGRTWSRILDQALASTIEARFAGAVPMRDALVRELARVGVPSPRGEIEAWLDDPTGFAALHGTTMTARLCATGDAASKKGDALTAAADYNRALAFAPHDAALLKIVARMNRRDARRDVLRRGWPYATAAVLVAGVAVVSARPLLRRSRAAPADSNANVPTVASPASAAPPVVTPVAKSLPEALGSARAVAHPVVGVRGTPPPKPAPRDVRFTSVEPEQGVYVAVDGAPPTSLDATRPLVLDEKAHQLVFTCYENLCDPTTRSVEAGERSTLLAVRLSIKPAKLLIRGNPSNHYFLLEDPTRYLQPGDSPSVIAMPHSAVRVVQVKERETDRSQSVELHAGKTTKPVDFLTSP